MKTPQEFIKDIITDFLNANEQLGEISMWKNNAIIQLMDFAKRIRSKELVQEGLIIIMALFNGFVKISEIEPAKDLMNLTMEEKRDIHSILMEEIS